MDKAPDAFRTISEVADELDVPQHVLRFWETRFAQIKPMKRGGGRRYYRPDDLDLLRGIRHLLYGEGYTIRGVQRILKDNGIRFVQSVWQSGAPQPEPHHRVDGEGDDEDALDATETAEDADADLRPEPAAAARAALRATDFSPAAEATRAPALSADDMQRLQAALAELAECRRLLDAAMKDDD